MDGRYLIRPCKAACVLGLLAAGLTWVGAAGASTRECQSWGAQPPDNGSFTNELQGVAATSACNAWAVGFYYDGTADQTLIEHWNGTTWKIQPAPNPRGLSSYGELYGVAATSPTSAWAVGYYTDSTDASQTLIEHWNGKKWHVQSSPNPGSCAAMPAVALRARGIDLASVAATSSSDAWAVGVQCGRNTIQTLIEHWNGKAWKAQRSPNPGGSNNESVLSGVAATSSGHAWAVGNYFKNDTVPDRTLVEHWNGRAWKVQPSPNADPSRAQNELLGVAATSSNNAWAVGDYGDLVADPPLVERWNGKVWKTEPSSGFPEGSLAGVAAISSRAAWAVGDYFNGSYDQNLILHCC